MRHAGPLLGIALGLAFNAAARGADAPVPASSVAPAPAIAPRSAPEPTRTERISREPLVASTRPALNLQAGDIRKYMMPNDYRELINAPDADRTTIIVEGKRELLPMKSEQPVPVGIVTPFWMLANPHKAWRALLPDLNAPPPGPPDVVPKREFRWGP